MITARLSRIMCFIFSRYTKLIIRFSFRRVVIGGDITDRGKSVLVIANHFSWWDGFWIEYMNLRLFRRNYHFMMLEEELRARMFLRTIGGYSIRRGSRDAVESMRYTINLLADSKNMVLFFPQGKIDSLYSSEARFEKGIAKIIDESAGKTQVVFAVNLIEYYSFTKPSLYMYLHEFDGAPDKAESAFNIFFNKTLEEHIRRGEQK